MKRKLIKQGVGGLTVYLPKQWTDEHHLKGGEEIIIEPLEGDLRVSAHTEDTKTSTSITLRGLTESSIRTLITSTYRTGYDIIAVEFNDTAQLEILKNVISTRLIGFEITKNAQNSCVIENITEPAAEQFDTILRKFFFSIGELIDATQQRLKNPESVGFEETEERIQRYDNFLRRIIMKERFKRKHSELLWSFLTVLVHAQRELYHLHKTLPMKVSKETIEYLLQVEALFEMVAKTYFDKSLDRISAIHDIQERLLYGTGYALLEEKRGKEAIAIHHLMAAMRQFYLSSSPLAGLLLNRSASS